MTLKNKIFKQITAVSKNAYFDVLDDTIKMKPMTLHLILLLNTIKILIKMMPNIKLVIGIEFQNTEIFLIKDVLQTGQKRFLLLEKLKIRFPRLLLLVI